MLAPKEKREKEKKRKEHCTTARGERQSSGAENPAANWRLPGTKKLRVLISQDPAPREARSKFFTAEAWPGCLQGRRWGLRQCCRPCFPLCSCHSSQKSCQNRLR